jgi:Pectate lyase superfamily protein
VAENITLSNVVTFQNDTTAVNTVNNNNATITTAFQDVLSLSGKSPNQMQSALDMNSNQIINLPPPATTNSPARLVDVVSNPTIVVPATGTSGHVVPFLDGVGNTWSNAQIFPNNSITNAEIVQSPANTIKGNNTGSSANVTDLTGAQVEQMLQFTQSGTGAVQRTLDAKVKADVWVSVIDFGADPTGATGSTAAIQAAINSLPTGGGVVFFPSGSYGINATIQIGNGSSSAQSTTQGIYLVGSGSMSVGPQIFWFGATSSSTAMFSVLGPMQNWGIKNLNINCTGTAGIGIQLIAASNGMVDHVNILNSTAFGLQTLSLATAATGNANTQFNTFNNINFSINNTTNSMGIILDGNGTNAVTNSSLNLFNNINIVIPSTSTAMNGIYLRDSDTNIFFNISIFGGGSQTNAMVFDYSGHSGGAWPSNCAFYNYGYPLGPIQSNYANVGAPTGAKPNRFYNVQDTNACVYPKINNTTYNPEFINPPVVLAAQSVSIGTTNLFPTNTYVAGLYRLNYFLDTTTAGTGGTVTVTLNWTGHAHAETFTSPTVSLTAAGANSLGAVVTYMDSGTMPTYSTTVAGATGSPLYALNIRMEKMD